MNNYEGVIGIVEVTSYETMCLWKEYHEEKGYTWVQQTSSSLVTVGEFGDMPVCIAPLVHIVDGKKIMFLEVTSIVVHWHMIEEWLKKSVPSAVNEKGYLNKHDAMNFHNLIR